MGFGSGHWLASGEHDLKGWWDVDHAKLRSWELNTEGWGWVVKFARNAEVWEIKGKVWTCFKHHCFFPIQENQTNKKIWISEITLNNQFILTTVAFFCHFLYYKNMEMLLWICWFDVSYSSYIKKLTFTSKKTLQFVKAESCQIRMLQNRKVSFTMK